MFTVNKKWWLYGLAGLASVLMGVWFLSQLKQTAAPVPTRSPSPSPQGLPLPSGIKINSGPVEFSGTGSAVDPLTSAVPWLNVSDLDTQQRVDRFTTQFGFTSPTQQATPNGISYRWQSEKKSLSYAPQRGTISYFDGTFLISSTRMEEKTIIDQARRFVTEKLTVPKEIKLELVKLSWVKSNGYTAQEVGGPAVADLANVEFQYVYQNHPLYLPVLAQSDASVQLNTEGVRSLKAKLLPEISLTDKAIHLLPIQEAQIKLLNQRGVVLKMVAEEFRESSAEIDITKVQISNVRVGYLLEDDRLSPVYVFRGRAPNNLAQSQYFQIEVAVRAEKQ